MAQHTKVSGKITKSTASVPISGKMDESTLVSGLITICRDTVFTSTLTVYDMTKALDKAIEIQDLYLLEKTGGKSGDFRREEASKPRTRR